MVELLNDRRLFVVWLVLINHQHQPIDYEKRTSFLV